MADLIANAHRLTVYLEWWEKLAAHRSNLTVPLRAIRKVELVEDVFDDAAVAAGERIPATRIRGITVTGTLDDPLTGGAVFAVCHAGGGSTSRHGVNVVLSGATVERIIISHADAEGLVERLKELTGL
ncbi:hypothetical protein CATYP_01640 [Corynebacterium atypicum]|uniref:Uncharacterized protein n=1 Tax=Corynebacterium atypicum TaxID=191610 RepID=A0ABN4DB67_9CORY|nr:hypothetical protein [Corynebacterium atypicum]AIG63595.1 hypothetical protein CATYP_01640 [Corynebacterium atypicum]